MAKNLKIIFSSPYGEEEIKFISLSAANTALKEAEMYTNCIHSAELRGAAILAECSPEDIISWEVI